MSLQGIFDSHAHYFDPRFDVEAPSGASGVLSEDFANGVSKIINVGTNPENSETAILQAKQYKGMYAAVGIHPEDCHYGKDLASAIGELRSIIGTEETRKQKKIVAIGEIGLDYHGAFFGEFPLDKEKEKQFFRAQMELARELSLPVIIHDREAHGDCFDIILQYPDVKGVFHSYSGSAEMAKDLARRGWYISFSGTLTFKNAPKVREAALVVPKDQLLVETDSPYLAPHPLRGSLNHSGLLSHTLSALAEIWNCTPEEATERTYHNACRLFLIT